MESLDDSPKLGHIKVEDLLVGENMAMDAASSAWVVLANLNVKYLTSLIVRVEKTDTGTNKIALPVFKRILFYATDLQEHMKADKELAGAIEQAKEARAKQEFAEQIGLPSEGPE